MKKHLVNKGIYTRIHGNTGKMPFRKTKILVDLNVREEVRDFVRNYAKTHGLPNPGRVKRANNITIFLPTEMTYKSVHEDFLNSLEADSALRELRYRVFVKIWKQLTPQIGFMSPRSDLCDTCQQFHRDLKYSCLDKETKKKNLTSTSNT